MCPHVRASELRVASAHQYGAHAQGFWAPGMTALRAPCEAAPGSFCPSGASVAEGILCPIGFYCTGQSRAMSLCVGGKLCRSPSQCSVGGSLAIPLSLASVCLSLASFSVINMMLHVATSTQARTHTPPALIHASIRHQLCYTGETAHRTRVHPDHTHALSTISQGCKQTRKRARVRLGSTARKARPLLQECRVQRVCMRMCSACYGM